ncbi:2-dehydropantoate 2-reductase [Pluteus cervinus]|uniref:2-dehydropantoate 2-reductase n=1 Tax=Pluteus cervinus TaxID=181527 RepID=A0ACD3BIE3_9AGAR|nr:2-dehydropantoate 2-reductase [Pluteus cervinus]
MRFHVLGLGSIGSLFAHQLRRVLPPTHSITLIHKTKQQARDAALKGSICVENQGLVSTASGFRSEVFEAPYLRPNPSTSQDEAQQPETISSLIVTTKAHQTVPAIQRLLPRLSQDSTIVLLQNGMGIYEQLVGSIFRNPQHRPHFILASNTHGAFLRGFYDVVHTGVGAIDFGIVPDPNGRDFEASLGDENIPRSDRKLSLSDIGPPDNDPASLRYASLRSTVAALQLTEALNTTWQSIDHVQLAMRRKLVVNSVVNPLTAIMGCRNGDIFLSPSAERIMERVCQEAAGAFSAQIRFETQSWLDNLPLEERAEDGERVDIGRIPPGLTKRSLMEEVKRVTEITKGNISSTLSDVRKGRPTEIDYLNGYLLRLGKTYRLPMPCNATLLNLVKMRSAIPLDQML